MTPSIYLSVIIPCYNEEENIKKGALGQVNDYLSNLKESWEVVISDDGSSDKSKNLIKEEIKKYKNFILLENPHAGKPSALWYGIQKTRGEYILFTDMDQSTPIRELSKLIPFTKDSSVGAVIGSRGLARKNFPFYRRLGAVVFITFRKLLILPEINDTQCGFKLFKKSVLLKIFPKLEFFRRVQKVKGWKVTSFDVELLYLIRKMFYKIEEVPVLWQDADISISKGGGMERYIKESKEMFFQVIRVKLNDMKGLYNVS
jgi:dolichyl-phosphate beta-glucosyltransferase